MIAIPCRRTENISTTPRGGYEYFDECGHAIDSAKNTPFFLWPVMPVYLITTTPEIPAEGNEWIKGVLPRLNRVADLKDNWDAEGSPRPDPAVIEAAKRLLSRLQDSLLGAVPIPFVCPIAGGGIQFEWTCSQKHLEIELLDASNIAFLKEESTPKGEIMESGEYPLDDAEITRQLLDWFTAA